MKEPIIQIQDFKGGMTLNDKMGREDAFHIGKSLDFFSRIGFLTVGHAWKNITYAASESLPTEFNCMIYAKKDGKKYFGGNDGKIYREATDGTLEVVRTITGAVIKGLAEYKDYLYYATDTALGKWDFDATWNDSWQTLNSVDWHHMIIQAAKLYIGNGQYVATYDGTNWAAQGLDLDTGWVVRCLAPFGLTNIVIGANFGSVKCDVLIWDRTAVSWNDTIPIPENIIQAMVYNSGYLWIWAGSSCNIYVCAEGSRQAIKVWSFTREDPLEDFNVYPYAVAVRKGTVYCGLSDVDDASVDRNPSGIYSFPLEPSKFALNIPIKKTGYDERYKSIANMGTTNTLYIGFRDYISAGSEYNNLKREETIDEASPYSDTAEYESFYFRAPKNKKLMTEQLGITMDTLPAGCNLTLSYKKDAQTSYTVLFSDFSTANSIEKKVDKRIEAQRIKLKLELRGSLTTTARPYIDSLFATGELINRI